MTDGAVLSMIYNPSIHHRRSFRLKGYDYSQEGLYYITICCQNWACLFGEIIVGVGASLADALDVDAPIAHNDNELNNDKGRPQGHAPATTNKTVGDMMDAFKSITTVEYIRGVKNMGWPPFNRKLWQRDYYEHIIRNKKSWHNISRYIINNPSKWKNDKFH